MIEIRSVEAEEITIISQLAAEIWPVCFASILTPEQIDNLLERIYSENNLKEEMKKGHRFWVAHEGNSFKGFVSAYKENQIVWLKKLYVLHKQQGKGIGNRLLDAATQAFLPAERQSLYVNRDNVEAQRYYIRKGFIRTEEVPVKMGDFDFVDFIYSRPLKP